jgi:hypothetical protein
LVDLGAFANGASHSILFEYIGPTGGTANFTVDNVQLICAINAISVASTTAVRTARGVTVRWSTGSDTDLLGFRVYRQDGAKRVRVSRSLIRSLGAFAGSRYRFLDRSAPQGRKLEYWIEAVSLAGGSSWHGPAAVGG